MSEQHLQIMFSLSPFSLSYTQTYYRHTHTHTHTHELAFNAKVSQTLWWFKGSRQWKSKGQALGLILSVFIHQPINYYAASRWHQGSCSLSWKTEGRGGEEMVLFDKRRERKSTKAERWEMEDRWGKRETCRCAAIPAQSLILFPVEKKMIDVANRQEGLSAVTKMTEECVFVLLCG